MRAQTRDVTIYAQGKILVDNDVTSILEPADGTISVRTRDYEDFVASLALFNSVAGVKSVSFQFYESPVNSGDISATWTAVGVPVVVALGSPVVGVCGEARKNRQEFSKPYMSVIATITHPDPGAATGFATLSLRGETLGRDDIATPNDRTDDDDV